MAAARRRRDLVHSHTWYANMAGHLAKLLHGVPHVVTAHSLEPRRPWKAEQLGGGYRISSWAERTAYEAADAIIAVSEGMRADVLDCYPALDPARVHVVHNGIDTELYHPVDEPRRAASATASTRTGRTCCSSGGSPGRRASGTCSRRRTGFDPDAQLVLCAGAPDTPEIAAETAAAVAELAAARPGVVLDRGDARPAEVRQVLSHATVFCCPSVYEPLGIVNLEAMACGTAVVASGRRRHPRGRRRRADRPARALRRARFGEFRRAAPPRSTSLLADPTGPRDGPGGPRAGGARVRLAAIAEQTVAVYDGCARRHHADRTPGRDGPGSAVSGCGADGSHGR